MFLYHADSQQKSQELTGLKLIATDSQIVKSLICGSKNNCVLSVFLFLFQSLFFWILVWRCVSVLHLVLLIRVSILVFLDFGLEDVVVLLVIFGVHGFNPCFFGFWSGGYNKI